MKKESRQTVAEYEKRIPTDRRISADDLRFCERCGREVSQKWNYCPNCGTAVHPQKNVEK